MTTEEIQGVFLLINIVAAVIVAIIASTKGRSGFLWFLYGFFLWPVAFIHILVVGKKEPEVQQVEPEEKRIPCPACKEMIKEGALVCPHCSNKLIKL